MAFNSSLTVLNVTVCLQAGGGGRCVLHGERSGVKEPGPAGSEHGGDLGAEEVIEDRDGTSSIDPETEWRRPQGGRKPGGTKKHKTRGFLSSTLKTVIQNTEPPETLLITVCNPTEAIVNY